MLENVLQEPSERGVDVVDGIRVFQRAGIY